jgi:feruloyl esterase
MHRFLKQGAVGESSTLVSSTHDPEQISDGCHGSVDDMDFNQHRRPHGTFWVSAVVVSGTFFISHLAAQVTSSNATGQVFPPGARAAAMRCERLRNLPLPNTTIMTAEIVPVGTPWEQPGSGPPPNGVAMAKAPASGAPGYFPLERPLLVAAHCRVEAVARPTRDSEIGLELWLPLDGWNGKFLMVGNGGWGGRFLAPSAALNEGYATASTDTGHKGQSGRFALGHPEKLIDFAYRAVHETAVRSKEIVAAFYDRPARLSYFDGCSTGGRQGLMEAQRYPEDFDGIIAAAPAHHMTHLAAWRLAVEANVIRNSAGAIPETKLALVNRAVLAACDGLDGVADEFLTDPRQCRYDPSSLLCGSGDADDCLSASQVAALKSGYQSASTGSGELIFPGPNRAGSC